MRGNATGAIPPHPARQQVTCAVLQLPYISAAEVHTALPYALLVEGLRQAFREDCTAPLRHVHAVSGTGDRLRLMPAWRAGREVGVKLVTVFPGNRERGLATVATLYQLLDGASGHPLALIDGEALTLRRTAAASALASTYPRFSIRAPSRPTRRPLPTQSRAVRITCKSTLSINQPLIRACARAYL